MICRPVTTAVLVLLAGLALAVGSRVEPQAVATAASPGAYPFELQVLFGNYRLAADRDAKRRCENSFLDFVELMWPAVDPGQPFVRGNVQEAIGRHLEAVTDGCIKNLLANVPPGSTKTYLVNVFWPAWEWGPRNRPDLRYMAWSYSPELALKANDDCRKIIKHPVYQRFWGDRFQIAENSDAKGYYENNKGGWRRSSSIKGAATGFRADRLIWDDPHNVRDADSAAALRDATRWFARTLPTRVRNMSGDVKVKVPFWVRDVHGDLPPDPNDDRPVTVSATVGIMQRVHLHDISGIILKNPRLGYEILLIEMRYKGDQHEARKLETWPKSSIGYQDWRTEYGQLADPVRFPEAKVAELEAQLIADGGGSDAVAAQLDQWPMQQGGSWFRTEWLPIIEPSDVPKDVPNGKRGWDFGGGGKSPKSDPTACARVARGTAGERKFYIWHTAAKRGSPGDQEMFIRQTHQDDPRDVDWSLPEDPGTGKNYADYIKRQCSVGRYVTSSPEVKDKVTRAKPVSGQAQLGQVVIVRHPGCEIARQELVDFPYGDHDDIVDAISRAFAALVAQPELPPPTPGWVFGGQ